MEGGNAQARADVAQSIYNRAADRNKRYGSNIREVITADAQYQPPSMAGDATPGAQEAILGWSGCHAGRRSCLAFLLGSGGQWAD